MALKYHHSSRGQIAYEKRGLGDPLLLVHSVHAGASHHEFDHNIQELARKFTVYAIDLMGFGESAMPRMTYTAQFYHHLLRDFVVEVIGEPANLVGSGESAGFVVAMAVYNDELVRKIVLIDPHLDPIRDHELGFPLANKVQQFLLGTLAMGKGLYDTLSSTFEVKRYLLTRFANPSRHISDTLIQDIHERASQPHALYAFVSNMTGHLSVDIPLWIRHVRAPVLVIWGEHAGPVPSERLLRPAAWSRGKRIEVIPGAAHWPHDEQSAKVNRLIEEFLEDQVAVAAAV
ncbi:MAG TPA: alpha/beta fold hydrolase [Tepidisphaeraceae bacterium]